MDRCWEVRNCPTVQKEKCSAYSYMLNCWERESLPCCKRNNKDRCMQCILYQICTEMEDALAISCKNICKADSSDNCIAAINKKNCWEVQDKLPCCKNKKDNCEECPQYFKALAPSK